VYLSKSRCGSPSRTGDCAWITEHPARHCPIKSLSSGASQALRRAGEVSDPVLVWLVFQAQSADFIEQGFVGDAEFFGGASFVPLGFLQRILNLESLDAGHRPLRHFLEVPVPDKPLVQHVAGHLLVGRLCRRQRDPPPLPFLFRKNSPPNRRRNLRQLRRLFLFARFGAEVSRPPKT
jgi:hypothetical protein